MTDLLSVLCQCVLGDLFGAQQADLHQVQRTDEAVVDAESAGAGDRVAQRHRPVVLDQQQSRGAVVRNAGQHVPIGVLLDHIDAFRGSSGTRERTCFGAWREVSGICTDPGHQGKGLGRVMMAAAEDWLRAAGVPKLQLLVRRENAKASAFYQTLGYEESTSVMLAKWLDGREATP